MNLTLERFSLLTRSSGPRNRTNCANRFTVEDLLIGLGWIQKPHVSDLLLLKYASHGDKMDPIIERMVIRWRKNAPDYKLSDKQMEALCQLALAEHLDPRSCTHCKGTGEIKREHAGRVMPVVCPSCWGTGRYRYSGRRKALALQIHKNTWNARGLEPFYRRMLQGLHAWETYGVRRLNRYLKEP